MRLWSSPCKSFSSNAIYALNELNINPRLLQAEYAVRGTVPTRAAQIKSDLPRNKEKYPFDSITECNIGNPQAFGQPYITFNRQVLDLVLNPQKASPEKCNYHIDIIKRANYYHNNIATSIGAYSHSAGYMFVRKNIQKFLEKRDNHKSNFANIILSNGASSSISAVLSLLISSKNTGIMIPIPQYPLYSALITLYGGKQVQYYLNEEDGWQLNIEDLQNSFNDAKQQGIAPKAIVMINPGNPTGQILKKETIKSVIEFCYKNNLMILADEVYQQNIYKENTKFVSFKQVLSEMPKEISGSVELASFHSVSKGLLGECGMRGGYVEFTNVSSDAIEHVQKINNLKSNINNIGQIVCDLMINPPNSTECSQETMQQYEKEVDSIFQSLKKRALIVTELLNKMTNISCQEVEGAMYAFPKLNLSQKAQEAAAAKGMIPDLFYCLEVLENTGIVLVPGSGFLQRPGTNHFRITTLILPEDRLLNKLDQLTLFNDSFHKKYSDL